nr:hypothetical protein [Haloferax sp. ATB1]
MNRPHRVGYAHDRADVERPDRELVEAFEEIPSTIVSDVTGNIGLTMDAGLRPAYDASRWPGPRSR